VKDYRFNSQDDLKTFLTAAEAADPNASYSACISGYSWGGPPADRKGLIAILHDQCTIDGQYARFHDLAQQVAKQTGQRVYMVYTTGRWHLLLFAIDVTTSVGVEGVEGKVWYDDMPGGVYANDQSISHYDPDGTFTMDGES